MESSNLAVYLVISILLYSHPVFLVAETSISYYHTKLTWTEARDFCFNQSGILESNHTEIMEHSDNKTGEMWTGTYTTWSQWAAIWDCNVHPQTVSAVFEDDSYAECQRFCQSTEYFGFNGTSCYCMDKPRVSTLYTFCKSSPKEFIKVYKQNITGVKRTLLDTPEEQQKCMSAQCQEGEIILRSEKCQNHYEAICDFGISAGTYTTQTDAANLCNNAGSFLKWYDKAFCNTGKKNQLWTSSTRDIYTRDLLESDKGLSFHPLMCQYMDMNNSLVRSGKCMDTRTFMCRFEKIEVVNETQNDRDTDTDTTGTLMLIFGLIGSLSLAVVVILAIIVCKISNSGKKNKGDFVFKQASNVKHNVNGAEHPSHHVDTDNIKGISTENALKESIGNFAIGGEGETKASREDYDDIESKVCFSNSVTQKDKKQSKKYKLHKIKNSQTLRNVDNYDDMEDKIGGSKPGSEKRSGKYKETQHGSKHKNSKYNTDHESENCTDIEEQNFNKKILNENVDAIDMTKLMEGQEYPMDVDYDEIEDSNDVSMPSKSKNECANELSPKGYTIMNMGNVSKGTLQSGIFEVSDGIEGLVKHDFCVNDAQKITKDERSEFSMPMIDDEYAEIEDSGDSVYSSASLIIDDDSGENRLIKSDHTANTSVNSNAQSSNDVEEYAEIESAGASVYPSASLIHDESDENRFTKSDNTGNASVNSNIQSTYDVLSHPVYAVSSKSSSNVKAGPDLVTEPEISTNILPKVSSGNFGNISQPGYFVVQAKVSDEQKQTHFDCDVHETFYDKLHSNRLEEYNDQSVYDQSMNSDKHGDETFYDKLHVNSLKESDNASADYDHI